MRKHRSAVNTSANQTRIRFAKIVPGCSLLNLVSIIEVPQPFPLSIYSKFSTQQRQQRQQRREKSQTVPEEFYRLFCSSKGRIDRHLWRLHL